MSASSQAAVITSINAHATGLAYSSGYSYGTNTYGREGMTYDETLTPGSTSLSAQARNNSYAGAAATSSLSFTPSLTELAFATSVNTSVVLGLPNSSGEAAATLQFDVNFTLTEPTAVSLRFDLGNAHYYQIDALGQAQAQVTLSQISGSDLALLYSRTTGYQAPTDPEGDGIFYTATLSPGDYLFSIESYSSANGSYAVANGGLQFSPVPEPAGALLIALGLASFLRRRRAAL